MRSPCGHKEASHSGFGDIWGCPVAGCDGTERTQPEVRTDGGTEAVMSGMAAWLPDPYAALPAAGPYAARLARPRPNPATHAPGLPIITHGNVYSGANVQRNGEKHGWPGHLANGNPPTGCGHVTVYRSVSFSPARDGYFCYDCGHEVTVKTP